MRAGESGAFLHQVADDFQMVVLNDRMARTAVHEEQDGVRAVKRFRVFRPAVQVKPRSDPGHILEALVQQLHAGVELMFAGTVARMAGDENDFLVRGARIDAPAQRRGQQSQQGCFHETNDSDGITPTCVCKPRRRGPSLQRT